MLLSAIANSVANSLTVPLEYLVGRLVTHIGHSLTSQKKKTVSESMKRLSSAVVTPAGNIRFGHSAIAASRRSSSSRASLNITSNPTTAGLQSDTASRTSAIALRSQLSMLTITISGSRVLLWHRSLSFQSRFSPVLTLMCLPKTKTGPTILMTMRMPVLLCLQLYKDVLPRRI